MLPLKLRLLKRLDRTVGRWLCGHAAATASRNGSAGSGWTPRPVPPEGVERILVIRPGGIGDAVLLFPMLRAIREHFCHAAIDVLGERRNAGVFAINGLIRKVYCYDQSPLTTYRRLRAADYQLAIDTEQYHYLSCLLANRLEPEFVCGFDTIGRGRFQTHRVRYSEHLYEAESFLELASALIGENLRFDPDHPFLDVDRRWTDWADRTLAGVGDDRPTTVIVPSASSPHRYWPPQRYAEVARRLNERGLRVVVLGGSDATTAAGIIQAACKDGGVLDFAGKTSLAQTAGLVKRARLYISADTGALHIAYGVGTPTVHMFGSGIQVKWAPRGGKYVVVNKHLPCSPCTRYGYTPPCQYGVECMDAITVEDVMQAIDKVLD